MYKILIVFFILLSVTTVSANYPSCGIPNSWFDPGSGKCVMNASDVVSYTNSTVALSSLNKDFYKNGWDVVRVTYNNISNSAIFGSTCAWGGAGNVDCQHPNWEWNTNDSINTMTYYTGSGATTNIYRCTKIGEVCTSDCGDGSCCGTAWTSVYVPFLFDLNCNTATWPLSGLCAGSLTINAITSAADSCSYVGQTSILNTELTNACPAGWDSTVTIITDAQCQQIVTAWGVATGISSCTGSTMTLLCKGPGVLTCPYGLPTEELGDGSEGCIFPPSCPSGGILSGDTCVVPTACTSPRYPAGWQTPSSMAPGTPIKALDVNIIRNDINLMRLDAGLPVCNWVEPISTTTPVKANHMNEMRICIDQVYDICGYGRPDTSVNTMAAVNMPIQGQHFIDLYLAVKNAP